MGRLNFFQGLIIFLSLVFLSAGGSLLRDSIAHPEQSWSLFGGALLCSLALMLGYFLRKQRVRGKYL
jgi:uncharacterized membrane protein YdcZ (DUF606 family)